MTRCRLHQCCLFGAESMPLGPRTQWSGAHVFEALAVLADDRHAVRAVLAERAAAARLALELVGVAEAVRGQPRVVHAVGERAVVVLAEPRVDAPRAAVVGARGAGLARVEDLGLSAVVAHDGPVLGGGVPAELDRLDPDRGRLGPGRPVVRLAAGVARCAEGARDLAEDRPVADLPDERVGRVMDDAP